MTRPSRSLRFVTIALLMFGCAAEDSVPLDDGRMLQSLDKDLSVGSRGDDVRAVNDYLSRFGYFPNAELQRTFASWRPIVAQPPAATDVYDARTADAIRALQRNNSLAQTGIVDAATRALLRESRCGVPDGIELGDGSEKFALGTSAWGKDGLTWMVTGGTTNPDGSVVTVAQARNAAASAFAKWAVPTKHTFTQITSGTPDIKIEFTPNSQPGVPFGSNTLANALYPADGGDIRVNSMKNWTVQTPPPGDKYHLHAVLIHEIGHALGVAHSSIEFPAPINAPAVMNSGLNPGMQRPALTPDDHVAALTRVIKWGKFDAATDDVAVQDHFGGQTIFVTGGASVPGGREIWRRDNGTWGLMPGGAVRIAANKDLPPWIVNDAGAVFSWNGNAWEQKPGICAKDIAIAGTPNIDQSVWIVSCTPAPGGFTTKRLLNSTWVDARAGIGAVRISVGPRFPGQTMNVPWITNNAGKIFRGMSSDPSAVGYEELPGLGTDIAVSGSGYAWLISVGAITGGFTIYSWADQPAGDGSPPAPAVRKWINVTGGAINIAASWWGYPIIANNQRSAYEPL